MISAEQIERVCAKIRDRFGPEKIILFGSYAGGAPTPDSDVDLLVVLRTTRRPVDRYLDVREVLDEFPVAFDLIVKTPEEFERGRRLVNSITYFADRYGKVLYERN